MLTSPSILAVLASLLLVNVVVNGNVLYCTVLYCTVLYCTVVLWYTHSKTAKLLRTLKIVENVFTLIPSTPAGDCSQLI